MIPFPKYVRLGGHIIRVKRVPNLIKDQSAFGMWNDGTLEITIDAGLTPSLAWETLWHEVCESINTATDSDLDHHIIQTSGLLIHQVFQSLFEKGQQDD